jgi:hypothetical protein
LLGDKDEAIRLLTTYFANNPAQRTFFKNDQTWWWDGIRSDPRFKSLTGSTG